MKIAWIVIALVAAYLVGHLLMVWRTRNDVPPPPPGGWKSAEDFDDADDEDDWPQSPGKR
jgi:hypothetical protein